jgi:hypothetical protein
MADDPNAKPTPPDWPPFLRLPVDPGERARRAQQAADELAQQAVDAQRELERKQREHKHTANGRKETARRRQLKADIVFKVAETEVSPGMPKEMAWQSAGKMLERVNKHLRLEKSLCKRDGSPCQMTHHDVYDAIRKPEVWSRLTSLPNR